MTVERSWSLDSQQVFAALGTTREGLSAEEARRRLTQYGRNVLQAKEREPWYVLLAHQFANPLVYLLIGAAVVKAVFKGPADAGVIVAVLVFMALIGFIQELKARQAMAALLELSAPRSKVRRGGVPAVVEAAELVPGDILLLEAGDRIGADARLVEAVELRVNESTFTGESLPVKKTVQVVAPDAPLHDRINMVFMGTAVSHGRGVAVVCATGMGTEIGRIAGAINTAVKDVTPLQRSIEKLGRAILWVVGGACLALGAVAFTKGMPWVDVLLLAVAASVAAIPEGLPAAVTVVLAICVNRMAKRNVLIRKLTAVETLGTATVICSDKTGTLTLNQMTVREVWTSGATYALTGGGYDPSGTFEREGVPADPMSDPVTAELLRGVVLCNDAAQRRGGSGWEIVGDPTEGALVVATAKAGIDVGHLREQAPRVGEMPFESERRFMATAHRIGDRTVVYVKGSVEKLLTLCGALRTPAGDVPLDERTRDLVLQANTSMGRRAMRVLAVACAPVTETEAVNLTETSFAGKLTFLGLTGMIDPPREEARRAVQQCRSAGIRVVMITGDNPVTAAAIAAQLGICGPEDTAVTGRELEAMNDRQLRETCRTRTVFARIEPLHKLRIVNAFKSEGHIVAMTGDGVNDAPALEAASIGVAMGITGTDVAKEAADMVLTDDNFASIVAAVEEGRIVFNRLRSATFFLLMTCAGELLTLFLSVFFYGESPLEPIQILWVNLVTGALVAIPLGLEPGIGDELTYPPRHPAVGLLYPGMLTRIITVGILMGVPVTWIFHHAPLPSAADPATVHTMRQTVVFTGIIIFEWLFAFQARSPEKGVFALGVLRNRWLFLCMVIGIGMQLMVVYLPAANAVFHTKPLTLSEWLWALLPGVTALGVEELRKAVAPRLFGAGQWRPVGGRAAGIQHPER